MREDVIAVLTQVISRMFVEETNHLAKSARFAPELRATASMCTKW